jgi:NTE family protein
LVRKSIGTNNNPSNSSKRKITVSSGSSDSSSNNSGGGGGDRSINSRKKPESKPETVLVIQGGGSLGAYGCGVYKTLSKYDIKFDIVAGTSIGAINASIIAGTRTDNPAKALEEFWFTLSETVTPSFLPNDVRQYLAAMYSAIWGNPNAFTPVWLVPFTNYYYYYSNIHDHQQPSNFYMCPYLYDITPLKKVLNDFVDFTKLDSPDRPRLIITSTDIIKGESVTFDSKRITMDADHVIACAGFPFYGIAWTIKDGRFLWDGALQSNTPLREVIDASPKNNKKVYITNLFPRKHDELPKNMFESWHRARDIMHTDKTDHNVRMSKVISKYLYLLNEMHDIISRVQHGLDEETKTRILKLEPLYQKLARERGAIIENITRIERTEETHFLFEDADFSIVTIKRLIREGELDAERAIFPGK